MFNPKLTVVCLTLAVSSVALADAVVELSPITPANAPGGYLPGSVVDFQVAVSQDRPVPTPIRGLRLDFGASDAALTFLGPDIFPLGSPDGVEEFVFDFSTVSTGAMYDLYPEYPTADLDYAGIGYMPGYMLEIPASGLGSLILGTGQVALPMAPGTYMMDALNAATGDPQNNAAQIRFGFGGDDPLTLWSAVPGYGDGLITGAALPLTVVPEPTTLALLALGGLALIRRR